MRADSPPRSPGPGYGESMRVVAGLIVVVALGGCSPEVKSVPPEPPATRTQVTPPSVTRAPLGTPTLAGFERARTLVDPYIDVQGDIDNPTYPAWATLSPELDAWLGKPTMMETYSDGEMRYFWAFVDGDTCHSFTFIVHADGTTTGGPELNTDVREPQPDEIHGFAECVGWSQGKRVGKLYARDR